MRVPAPRHPPPSRPRAAAGAPGPADLRRVLQLQRTAGNAAATWALQRQAVAAPPTAKLGYRPFARWLSEVTGGDWRV